MNPDVLQDLVKFLLSLGYSKKELFAMTEEELANLAWAETGKLLKP
jgi:hypothetical protein